MSEYYIHDDAHGRDGPFDIPALLVKIRSGKLHMDTLISDSSGDIRPAYNWANVRPLLQESTIRYEAITRSYSAGQHFKRALKTGWGFLGQHMGFSAFSGLAILFSFGFGAILGQLLTWQAGLIVGFMLSLIFQQLIMTLIICAYHDKPLNHRFFQNYLLPCIPTALITAGSIAVFAVFGLVLGILPGVILLSLCAFSPFIILNKKINALDSIRQSVSLTSNSGERFGAIFGLNALNTLGLLLVFPLPITIPLIGAALVDLYEEANAG